MAWSHLDWFDHLATSIIEPRLDWFGIFGDVAGLPDFGCAEVGVVVFQAGDVAGFERFNIWDAVSNFLPAVSRLFPIFPIYVAFCLWFISSRII